VPRPQGEAEEQVSFQSCLKVNQTTPPQAAGMPFENRFLIAASYGNQTHSD